MVKNDLQKLTGLVWFFPNKEWQHEEMLQATLHLLPKPPSLPHKAYHEGTFVTGRVGRGPCEWSTFQSKWWRIGGCLRCAMYLSCFAGMNGLKFLNLNLKAGLFLKPFTNEFSKTVILNLGLTVKHHHLMGVSKNRGTPKWMVYSWKLENPIKMDVLGVPLFSENIHFQVEPFFSKTLGRLGQQLGALLF